MTDTTPNSVDELSTTLKTIQPKNTLLNTSISSTIIQLICKRFNGVDLSLHKLDPNFILFVCDLIENSFSNSSVQKVDKKTQVILVLKTLIPSLTNDELQSIDKIIEFIHSSGQITKIEKIVVKVIPIFKRVKRFFFPKK